MINDRQIFSPRQGKLVAIKISNFSPYFNDTILQNNPENYKHHQRKKLIHTSYSQNRHNQNELRTIHTSFQVRKHQQPEFNTIQPTGIDKQEFLLPKVNQNMKELKQLMKQKIAALKEIRKDNPNAYNFSQFKIKDIQRDKWNLSTLHSRKTSESPYSKPIKNKRISINHQSRINPQKLVKQSKNKKMILIGGSMPVRAISNPDPLPLDSYIKQFKISKISSVRRNRQQQQGSTSMAQRYENDCKPWQIQQPSNLYHLYQR